MQVQLEAEIETLKVALSNAQQVKDCIEARLQVELQEQQQQAAGMAAELAQLKSQVEVLTAERDLAAERVVMLQVRIPCCT